MMKITAKNFMGTIIDADGRCENTGHAVSCPFVHHSNCRGYLCAAYTAFSDTQTDPDGIPAEDRGYCALVYK